MSRVVRKYGKARAKPIVSETLFRELPRSPVKSRQRPTDIVDDLTEKFVAASLEDAQPAQELQESINPPIPAKEKENTVEASTRLPESSDEETPPEDPSCITDYSTITETDLQILTWDDVCPFGNQIQKIAEASYAEVYRIVNTKGTSIIKVIRLESPIKPQTKTQQASGLVDEEPHSEDDLAGELRISEWLADIPGFVVYKQRYVVQGRASKALLETHQAFHRRAKRKDPDRLQFYPSPSRYLDDTRFLVVELGDAGTALEDFPLQNIAQVWDIFFHTAVALARAEDLARFEHRDLHEGNLCVRVTAPPTERTGSDPCQFGYSGLDITILDYGLSRASEGEGDGEGEEGEVVAYDLEKDLGIFTGTHAPQCRVYRQMRSFLLRGDRSCLPPEAHNAPYDLDVDGKKIDWKGYYPYTNVLWLAYAYQYLLDNFKGEKKKELAQFRKATRQLWLHIDPGSPKTVLSFSSAGDVVKFAIDCGWIREEQLVECGSIVGEDGVTGIADSIIEVSTVQDAHLRRSPRRRTKPVE